MRSPRPLVFAFVALASVTALTAQTTPTDDRDPRITDLPWRHLGPANPTGRITDIDIHPSDPSTWYVATAGGGLWKTQNRGITWSVHFDQQATVSIGDVAVAPSDPSIVWIGSGEENGRNSVGWGDGVYKSTDAGKTWSHMGLEPTFQIGHIAIHPENPDIVFVAALGRLWGQNPDRGIFRTMDGGKTWQKVLYLDDKTGAIDVRMDPGDPAILYACMYERSRDGFDGNDPAVRFGTNSGFFKSTDGGDTWRQVSEGLPTCKWGRSGLTLHEGDPKTLYMIVETERSGWATGERAMPAQRNNNSNRPLMGIRGPRNRGGNSGAQLTSVTNGGPAAAAGLKSGDVIVKLGKEIVSNYGDLVEQIGDYKAGDEVDVVYKRGGKEASAKLKFGSRGQTTGNRGIAGQLPNGGRLGGQRANAQRRQGDKGFETGGVFRSDDRGETWTRVNSLTDRPFYYSVIAVAPSDPDRIYSCGVSFYVSKDGGKEFKTINRGIHVDFHGIWVNPTDPDHVIACCDGGVNVSYDAGDSWEVIKGISAAQYYKVSADNRVPYHVWGGLQDNGTWGGPSRSRFREGITLNDWRYVYGGDGFTAFADPVEVDILYATSQGGNVGGLDLTGAGRMRIQKPGGRYNWDAPFFLSPHNRLTLYHAGQHVCRGERNGLSIRTREISPELGLTDRGTATAIAESPVRQGRLWAGTDDGALWRSMDGGVNWEEIHGKVIGLPGPRYVSHIEASAHDADRVFVTFEGHRSDDRSTYVYVSEDNGDTWTSLAGGLPMGHPVHVLREDPVNSRLLFVGTEFSCFVSLDRGKSWSPFAENLPTVAVRDLFIHRRDADLITGTHGRGVWVVDIAPLRQTRLSVTAKPAHLFKPEDAHLWQDESRVLLGSRGFRASNPPVGVPIYVWLRDKPKGKPSVTIHDITGEKVATVSGEARAGLQRLFWSARIDRSRARPGAYTVRLNYQDDLQSQPFELLPDPDPAMRTASPTILTRPGSTSQSR